MQAEDKHLKALLDRGCTIKASPGLEEAIMNRVHMASKVRKGSQKPVVNIRLIVSLVLGYVVLSFFALLISFMFDQGFSFELKNIPLLFSPDVEKVTTLVLSLLGFWVLTGLSIWLKKFLARKP